MNNPVNQYLRVAFVIVTYNRQEDLRNCVTSINSQNVIEPVIFIVDNASSKETKELLKQYENVVYIDPSYNSGPAGGFAIGMQKAFENGFPYYCLCNDDNIFEDDNVLSKMLDQYQVLQSQNPAFLTLRLIFDETYYPATFWNGLFYQKRINIQQPFHKSDIITFNGALINHQAIASVGFPNEKYFMMMEEVEYCLRIVDKGFNNYIMPGGIIDLKRGSMDKVPLWRQYYQSRNQVYMTLWERKSFKEISLCFFRQVKFIYGIVRYQDKKAKRIYYRLKGVFHGLTGKMGVTINPATFKA
ncbi:MAG: glycosyltransferase family 2 protein [Filimonas sp.]|nr:glycosyltransferase family 2 protein [Filimonas sp.]